MNLAILVFAGQAGRLLDQRLGVFKIIYRHQYPFSMRHNFAADYLRATGMPLHRLRAADEMNQSFGLENQSAYSRL
jgi:hypothetical protein